MKRLRHCPDQILLASENWKMCVILWYALYLEQWLRRHPGVKFLFSTNPDDKKGPNNAKKQYANRVKRVCWEDPEFISLHDETGDNANKGLGTHSCRKYSSDEAAKKGAGDQQVEYRGR